MINERPAVASPSSSDDGKVRVLAPSRSSQLPSRRVPGGDARARWQTSLRDFALDAMPTARLMRSAGLLLLLASHAAAFNTQPIKPRSPTPKATTSAAPAALSRPATTSVVGATALLPAPPSSRPYPCASGKDA